MSQDLVEVYRAMNPSEANLIQSYLEAHDIPVMAVQEGAGAAYGITVGILGEVRLLVTKERETRARELIAEMQRGTTDSVDEDSAPDSSEPN